MKKFSFIFLLVLSVFLNGCENTNIDYVKNIYVSKQDEKYFIELDYYDFKSENEEYISSSYTANDLFKIIPKLMNDKNYNFRICENCFINIDNIEINNAFSFLNSLNLPPYTNLYGITSNFDISNFNKTNHIKNPMCDFSYTDNKVSGTLVSTMGAIMIKNNDILPLTKKEFQMIKLISNDIDEINYTFKDDKLFCHLTDISCYHYIDNNIYNINIIMVLKEYKGLTDTARNIENFKNGLKEDLKTNINDVFNNENLNEFYSLDWKKYEENKNYDDIKINITIL